MFRIVRGVDAIPFDAFIEACQSTRANHVFKVQYKASRINCYRYSFFVNIICSWNALPSSLSNITSLSSTKFLLKSHFNMTV